MSSANYTVTAVSYLNTKPFLYGLLSSPLIDFLDIILDYPANCAQNILSGKADLGLIPTGILSQLESYHIISDYCIGSVHQVKTVCLFSHKPIDAIDTVILDYQSKTSVKLLKILLALHWKLTPKLIDGKPGFTHDIPPNAAGLVIGDRAIPMLTQFEYHYDLATEWHSFTHGLPFVFAVWISRKKIDPLIERIFNNALQHGLDKIDDLIKILPSPHDHFDLKKYFKEDISYHLDDKKRESLALFQEYILKLHI